LGQAYKIVRLLVLNKKWNILILFSSHRRRAPKQGSTSIFLNMFFYTGGLQIGPISGVYFKIVNSSHRRRARN
jgi:hypothetical protein